MRLAYLSTDEVNLALAPEMALACGVTADPVWPKDAPPGGEYDALLCDWDSWPAERRQQFLAGAGSSPNRPVAVHGYGLTDDEAGALRSRGVAVHRRLRPEVFRRLRRAALVVRPRRPHCQSARSNRGM